MSKIRSTETKVEVILRKKLWHKGIRYRKNYSKLPGKPDIAITTKKIAIFIDGEFWHGYDWKKKKQKIKVNRNYWIPKIEGNIKRDKIVNKQLKKEGWNVIRFWEHQIKNDLEKSIDKINTIIKNECAIIDDQNPNNTISKYNNKINQLNEIYTILGNELKNI